MTEKELKERYPDKSFGVVNIRRKYAYPRIEQDLITPSHITKKMFTYDSGEQVLVTVNVSDNAQVIDNGWFVYLNHSCDEWEIGDIEDSQEFSKNLDEAIKYCLNNQ